jgi:hypothetical protein
MKIPSQRFKEEIINTMFYSVKEAPNSEVAISKLPQHVAELTRSLRFIKATTFRHFDVRFIKLKLNV